MQPQIEEVRVLPESQAKKYRIRARLELGQTEAEFQEVSGDTLILAEIVRDENESRITWRSFDGSSIRDLDEDERLLAGLSLIEDVKGSMSGASRRAWDALTVQLEADLAARGLDLELVG